MERPGLVGKLLVESPSLWASNRQLLKESRTIRRWPERMVLAVGTAEAGRADKNQSVVDDVRELAGILRRAGLNEKRLRLVIEEAASHSESAWARRFPEALRFLFGQ
jgi:predicted alpha/beta superfamily hydrolase